MKKLFSISILALFGLVFTLNGAEASHYRPLSVIVNKPVGEEVIMDEATPETAGKMEAAQEENLEKPAAEPTTPAMENEEFDGVWESGGGETSCCEEETICCEDACTCCCVRRPCWIRRCWRRMMMRCCVPGMGTAMATAPATETDSGCGCGN